MADIFIELLLCGASASMDQRIKEFFEITGWNYMLRWLYVEELVENKNSSFSVEEDEEDFVSGNTSFLSKWA